MARSPRPIARSRRVPNVIAAPSVEALARALGADDAAALAARDAISAGRFRVVLAFHREDGSPLTDADLEALRAFAPNPVGVAERAPRPAKKSSAKKTARASKKAAPTAKKRAA